MLLFLHKFKHTNSYYIHTAQIHRKSLRNKGFGLLHWAVLISTPSLQDLKPANILNDRERIARLKPQLSQLVGSKRAESTPLFPALQGFSSSSSFMRKWSVVRLHPFFFFQVFGGDGDRYK